VAQHATSANALVAIGVALERRVRGMAMDGDVALATSAVLDRLDISEVVAQADVSDLAPVLAGIRAELLFGGKVLCGESTRWPLEEGLRQAFGDVSAGFPALLKRRVAPRLPGLIERLETPGAALLDVGVGVGALSIAMLCHWPALRIVGVDPSPQAIAQAAANIRAVGLEPRIELRTCRGEEIADMNAFDLIFVPTAFIAKAQVCAIVARSRLALRPGGWLLVAMIAPGQDALGDALARFRTAAWGGTVFDATEAADLLGGYGYADICRLPGLAGAPVAFIAARRGDNVAGHTNSTA
jgi:precorrin-6B methylase 2